MAKKDELDIVRHLIDMHLLGEDREGKVAIQAERSAGLAENYRNEGFLREAVGEMRRSLLLNGNDANLSLLSEWEKELSVIERECPYGCGRQLPKELPGSCPSCSRLINPCPGCNHPNRYIDPYCRSCGKKLPNAFDKNHSPEHFSRVWFRPMRIDDITKTPVIVGDAMVIPLFSDGALLGLKAGNGEIAWKLSNLGIDKHTRLVFLYPYLYLFSQKIVQRILMGPDTMAPETLYSGSDLHDNRQSFPLSDGKMIYFPVIGGLFVHNVFRRSGTFVRLNSEYSESLFPVKKGKDIFFFSQKGNVYTLASDSLNLSHTLGSFDLVSPPASPANGTWIYFECFNNAKRMISAWRPESNTILSNPLPDDLYTQEDVSFHHPPLVYKDGALVVSTQGPVVYHAACIGTTMDLRDIRIDITAGIRRVMNVEFLFSLIIDSLFISRTSDGFFYMDLTDKTQGNIEFFGSELMSRPLCFGNRLFLVCKDGVRCYSF